MLCSGHPACRELTSVDGTHGSRMASLAAPL
jgi:hypothetical protein